MITEKTKITVTQGLISYKTRSGMGLRIVNVYVGAGECRIVAFALLSGDREPMGLCESEIKELIDDAKRRVE